MSPRDAELVFDIGKHEAVDGLSKIHDNLERKLAALGRPDLLSAALCVSACYVKSWLEMVESTAPEREQALIKTMAKLVVEGLK